MRHITAAVSLFTSLVTAQDFLHYKFDSACTTEIINYATGPQAFAGNGTLQSNSALSPFDTGVFGGSLAGGANAAPTYYNRVVSGWDPSAQPLTGDLTMAWFMRLRSGAALVRARCSSGSSAAAAAPAAAAPRRRRRRRPRAPRRRRRARRAAGSRCVVRLEGASLGRRSASAAQWLRRGACCQVPAASCVRLQGKSSEGVELPLSFVGELVHVSFRQRVIKLLALVSHRGRARPCAAADG